MPSYTRELGRVAFLTALAVLPPCRLVAQLEGGPAIGDPAPVIQVPDLDGRMVDLGTLIGKRPVLIEFWATWCEPCSALMPRVDSAFATYGDRVAFVGINVSINETVPGVRAWVARHRPVFQVLYDSAGTAIRAYDIQATSTVIIVGKDGRVAYAGVGAGQDLSTALSRVVQSGPTDRSR